MFEKELEMLKAKKRGQMGVGQLPAILKIATAVLLLVVVGILIFGILGSSTITSAITLQNQSQLTNATQLAGNTFYGFISLAGLVFTVLLVVVAIGAFYWLAGGRF